MFAHRSDLDSSHRNHRRRGFLPDEHGLAGFLSKDSRKSFQRARRQRMIKTCDDFDPELQKNNNGVH